MNYSPFIFCGSHQTEGMNIVINSTTLPTSFFQDAEGLVEVSAPEITAILGSSIRSITTLQKVYLPKCTSITGTYSLAVNPALTECTIGSRGYAISSIPATCFNQCTQSDLTITLYTSGGAPLAGQPWGATNATIVYEDADL